MDANKFILKKYFKALAVLLLGSFFWGGALGDAVERIEEGRKGGQPRNFT